LEIAETFNGSETVVEYEKGQERVHIQQHAPPLLTYDATLGEAASKGTQASPPSEGQNMFARAWADPDLRRAVYFVMAIIAFILFLRSCA